MIFISNFKVFLTLILPQKKKKVFLKLLKKYLF